MALSGDRRGHRKAIQLLMKINPSSQAPFTLRQKNTQGRGLYYLVKAVPGSGVHRVVRTSLRLGNPDIHSPRSIWPFQTNRD